MTILYKITDDDDRTALGCQWGAGLEHTAPGLGPLGGSGWLYAFTHPYLAAFFAPWLPYEGYRLWRADGVVGLTGSGFEVGCTHLATIARLALPAVDVEASIRFARAVARLAPPSREAEDTLADAELYVASDMPIWARQAAAMAVGYAVEGTTKLPLAALAEAATAGKRTEGGVV